METYLEDLACLCLSAPTGAARPLCAAGWLFFDLAVEACCKVCLKIIVSLAALELTALQVERTTQDSVAFVQYYIALVSQILAF